MGRALTLARERMEGQQLGKVLSNRYSEKQESVAATVASRHAVQIGGQFYDAELDATATGTVVQVVNVGRPGAARYVSAASASVAAVTAAVAPSASVGSGGMVQHALDSTYHTGQLQPWQATWALAADGSRQLTGDLLVAAGKTIDGVDLSAHAANVNAHHSQSHVLATTGALGPDHTVSGLSAGQVLKAAGPTTALFALLDYAELVYSGGGANLDIFGLSAANSPARLTPSADVSGGENAILRSNAGVLTVKELLAATKVRTQLLDTASGDLTLAPATGVTSLMELRAATRVLTPLINTASGDLTLSPAGDVILTPGSGAWVELSNGKALRTVSFASGFAGNGLRLDHGVGEAGKTSLEVDNVWVRGRMHVYELLIHQIRATNGSFFVSNTGKIATRTLYSGTEGAVNSQYTLNTDPEHGFVVGDLIRAQRWTGTGTYQSNLEVTLVGSATNFRAKLVSGDAPQVGYEYVRLGSTSSADRKGGIYLTADDSGAPFLDIFDGVNSFATWGTPGVIKTRLGKLDGLGLSGGYSNEYGLFAGNGSTDADAYLRLSNSTNRLNNLSLEWWAGGSKLISITPGGGVDIRGAALESSVRAYTFSSPSTTFAGLYATQTASANWLGLRLIGNLGDTASDLLFSVTNSNNETSTTLTLEAVDWTETARIKLAAESVGTDGSLIELTADATTISGTLAVSGTTTLGTGSNMAEVLRINAERAWSFGAFGGGGATEIHLYPVVDSKYFRITDAANTVNILSIYGSAATPSIAIGAPFTVSSSMSTSSWLSVGGTLTTVGTITIDPGDTTGTAFLSAGAIQLGHGRTDSGNAYIDLVGDATYSDYGLRIIRYNTGANADADISHKGTGRLRLLAYEAGSIEIWTSSTKRLGVDSAGLVAIGAHTPTSKLDVDGNVRAAGFYADAENGGIAGTVGLSGGSNTAANGTGVGTIYMKGATNRSSGAFIKVYIGTAIWYIPAFATITG